MNTEAAMRRIYLDMAVLGVAGAAILLVWKGWWFAAGFAAGAALSGLNFHWLKGAVDVLAAKFISPAPDSRRPSPRRVAAKFILRYALIGAAGYVIFRSSMVSLGAFLGGLFVFVAAVLVEMIYELSMGTSHGT